MGRARQPPVVAFLAAATLGFAPLQPSRNVGAITLLAQSEGHTADDELRSALQDPDPRVRLMAARVIGVGDHRELLGNLIGALLREQDHTTGAEIVRAALYLGGEKDLALIERHIPRFGVDAALAKAEWLARTRPREFLDTLASVAGRDDAEAVQHPSLIAMVAAQHPQVRAELFEAWMRVAPQRAWGELLGLTFSPPAALEPGGSVLKAALLSGRPSVREETVWFLVRALRDERKVPDDVLDTTLPIDTPGTSEWERFGRELISRHRKKVTTPDRSALLAAEGKSRRVDRDLTDFPRLSKPERDALAVVTGGRRASVLDDWGSTFPSARTVILPAPGVVAATLEAAECKVAGEVGEALLSYWPDGRPRQIRVDAGRLPPQCVQAITALMRVSIAEPTYPATDATQRVVLPFHSAFLACTARPERAPHPMQPPSTVSIKAPKKTRDVKPRYPLEAQQARIQGVVVIAAVIGQHGCIGRARVVRSIPQLDLAALWAVTQWLFEPTQVDGQAFPVHFNVTVNFELR